MLQPRLAALTREEKTSEDERRKNVKVVEKSTVMVKNVLVSKKGEKLVRKVRKNVNTDAEEKKYLANCLSVGKSRNLEHGSSGKSWGRIQIQTLDLKSGGNE